MSIKGLVHKICFFFSYKRIKHKLIFFFNIIKSINLRLNSYILSKKYHKGYKPFFKVNLELILSKEVHLPSLHKNDGLNTVWWNKVTKELKVHLINGDLNLLNNPILSLGFFIKTWNLNLFFNKQLNFLESKFTNKELLKILIEDHCLFPPIVNKKYMTSEMLVYHATHLAMFEETTSFYFKNMKTIVEFGGGYGGFIRVLKRFSNKKQTHIIIDLPEMLVLQKYYLENALPEIYKDINLVINKETKLEKNKINLIPLNLIDKYKQDIRDFNVDLFIATFSLSETNRKTQKKIEDLDFFSPKYILYGYWNNESEMLPASVLTKFNSYEDIFHEAAFFDPHGHEWYRIMKRTELSQNNSP